MHEIASIEIGQRPPQPASGTKAYPDIMEKTKRIMLTPRVNEKRHKQSHTPEENFQSIRTKYVFYYSFHLASQLHLILRKIIDLSFQNNKKREHIEIRPRKSLAKNLSIYYMYCLLIRVQPGLHQSLRQGRMNRHNMPQIFRGTVKFH